MVCQEVHQGTQEISQIEDGINLLFCRRFPLVIGGDCPVLLGCLAAAVQIHHYNIGLLFIDGHEDAYPPHQSPTGEAADMELGFALGQNVPYRIRNVIGSVPLIKHSKVCLLGIRDRKDLKNLNVKSLAGKVQSYDDIILRKSNIETLTSKALKRLRSNDNVIWLHIDLDVLSTKSLPAQDYLQPGGLSWKQLEKLCKSALSSGHIIGCDVTIYNPDLDPNNKFAKHIVNFLATVLST
ncbi:MAG TPA: arginase family protein [Nitrosopumilaceae archaeon]|nr:arginase family protein [Nitrosopumilaceae archaeon]